MRVALIGSGMVAATHVMALRDVGHAIEAVYSRRAEARERFAREHGVAAASSVEALAESPAVDAVIITTPPDQRIELVELFAAAGKPLLLEKPLERTTAAATRIVETCEQHGVPLGVVLQHRFRELSVRLKDLLDTGALGAMRIVEIVVPWWREQAYYDVPGRGTLTRDGGGVLLTQAIHTLDLVLGVCGPVASVRALAATSAQHSMECEDFVNAGLRFANGALGTLYATTGAFPGGGESIVIHAEHASARLGAGTLDVHWRDGRTEQFGHVVQSGGGADPMAFTHAWHAAVMADFADALRDARPPRVTGRMALGVHHLIDALLSSSRSGGIETTVAAG